MVKYILTALVRSVVILLCLSYVVINLGDLHTKLLLARARKAIFFASTQFNPKSGGTAFQMDTPDGPRIITNAHVCRVFSSNKAALHTYDGKVFIRKIIKISKSADLCMIGGIEGYGSLGVGGSLGLFSRVRIAGHPYGGDFTFSQGIIMAKPDIELPTKLSAEDCKGERFRLKRSWDGLVCMRMNETLYTTAKIYPGNSGSPVFNFWGNVSGIAFAADTRTHNGFIIPLEKLVEFIN